LPQDGADAKAHLTGRLAVCACGGHGNLQSDQRTLRSHRGRTPGL